MLSIIKLSVIGTIAFSFVFFGGLFFLRLIDKFKYMQKGFFHLFPYAILITFTSLVIFSGRDLSAGMFASLTESYAQSSIQLMIQRLSTLFILLASIERVANGIINKRYASPEFPVYLIVVFIFWFTTIFSAGFLSDNPIRTHEIFYPLIIMLATLFLSEQDKEALLKSTRNSILLVLVVSTLLLVVKPSLVLDSGYIGGLIPGLPRFVGITPHAVMMAALALFAAIILYFKPFENSLLNKSAWFLLLFSIFLAQSKTIWVTAILFIIVVKAYSELRYVIKDGKITKKLLLFTIPLIFVFTVISSVLLLKGAADNVVDQDRIEQISSLTGRDVIWEKVLEDRSSHSVFGYGPKYFGTFGIANVTHGHNQFFDTLAKAGEIGVIGLFIIFLLILYSVVANFFSSKGLFLVLVFLFILIRSISETPLTMLGYTMDMIFFIVLLVLMTLKHDHVIHHQQ